MSATNGGNSRWQISSARSQRGANGHPGGRCATSGGKPRNLVQLTLLVDGVGHGAEQSLRVRIAGRGEEFARFGLLENLSGVHHDDVVGHAGDDAEVVRDENDARPGVDFELFDEFENLGLNRHVERGGRLVGDEQFRLARKRHGDHHALSHAAGKFVRVAIDAHSCIGYADRLQHFDGVFVSLLFRVTEMKPRNLHQLFRDAHERIERGHRVLKNHADALAANPAHFIFGKSARMSCPSKMISPETILPGRVWNRGG